MKYWAYLAAKLIVAGVVLRGLGWAIFHSWPQTEVFLAGRRVRSDLFSHDLPYTFTMWLYALVCAGVVWVIVWDQRYRCRTCLRRLRMPIQSGSWNHVLFGAPRTDYICLYGHGTLRVSELQITGHQEPDWEPHDDMWKELFSLEETKK